MADIKSSNVRAIVVELIKKEFQKYMLWERVERRVTVMAADLPEPTTDKKRKDLVKGLKDIKSYLLDQGATELSTEFLDDEIDRYEQTTQISSHEEAEEGISSDIINKYSRLSYGNEGVVGIHLGLNYEQLKRLTNGVYKQTGLIKFYVSREKSVYGKIVGQIYERPQKIPVATLYQSKKVHQDTGEPLTKKVALFGELIARTRNDIIKEVQAEFYVYQFITEHNQELILLSTTPQETGDYVVTGVTTQIDDHKQLTDSAKLPTKLPYIFAQKLTSRIATFNNHSEFNTFLSNAKINKHKIFNIPFTIKAGEQLYVTRHPLWFKWMIWAWLTHRAKGIFNKYPLHFMIIGPKHSGKSLLLNALHYRSGESRNIFSGSSSTLKNLIPSFKYNPAKMGYLAECNRYGFLDELFRCIFGAKGGSEMNSMEEAVALMNDLLEHQKREAGSGVSRINVNMTARVLGTTNPVRGVNNMQDVQKKFDSSFLSRWLIYYQDEKGDHVRMIRDCNDEDLKIHDYDIETNEWLSVLDYLQSFDASYDNKRVEEMMKEAIPVLTEDLLMHYESRHKHHAYCVMDGLIKTRCLFQKDMKFQAIEEDYERFRNVWSSVIKSWVNPDSLRHMKLELRKYYLPEYAQWLFKKVCEKKRPISRDDYRALAKQALTDSEFVAAAVILRENELIVESFGGIMPYYMTDEYRAEKEKENEGDGKED